MNIPPLTHASSPYGAQMGRPNAVPCVKTEAIKLTLRRLDWVDGDYDKGGAYWGNSGNGSMFRAYGWCASGIPVEIFVRGESRDDARATVKAILPNARFYQ